MQDSIEGVAEFQLFQRSCVGRSSEDLPPRHHSAVLSNALEPSSQINCGRVCAAAG